MGQFFQPDGGTDPEYVDLGQSQGARASEARDQLERLWVEAEPYLDRDVQVRALTGLQQAFWEVYSCVAIRRAGLLVTPRERRRKRDQGPDLQVGNVDAWIEAVAVTAGVGEDAVQPRQGRGVVEIPDAKIKLRLTSALGEKRQKYERYLESGLVLPGEPRVVAINAGAVPYAHKEYDPPRIVRAVFPIGWPMAFVNTSSGTVSDGGYERRDSEVKHSGADVATNTFMSGNCSAVSAVLYSAATPYSIIDHDLGAEFVLVHNPTAATPLPRGFLRIGVEYWAVGDSIERHDHNAGHA